MFRAYRAYRVLRVWGVGFGAPKPEAISLNTSCDLPKLTLCFERPCDTPIRVERRVQGIFNVVGTSTP